MGLVVTRKTGESIKIGDEIHIKVHKILKSRVTLVIEAPREIRIVHLNTNQGDDSDAPRADR